MDKRIKYDLTNPIIKHGLFMLAKGVGGTSRSMHVVHYFQQNGYPNMKYSNVYFLFQRAKRSNPKLANLNANYHQRMKAKVQNRRKRKAEAKQQAIKEAKYRKHLFMHEVDHAQQLSANYTKLQNTNSKLSNDNQRLKNELATMKSTINQQNNIINQLRTRVGVQNHKLNNVQGLVQVGVGVNKFNQRFPLLANVLPNQQPPLYVMLYNGSLPLMYNNHN